MFISYCFLLDFILYILFTLFILFAGTRFKVEAENSRSDKHQSIKTLCSAAATLEMNVSHLPRS